MKIIMTAFIAVFFCLYNFCALVNAQTIYVTGVTKITLRSGPGVDNKIVAMLVSGTKLTMVNHQSDWSEVATEKGKIGWVLTRFLTEAPPLSQVVKSLKKKNKQLVEELESLRNEHETMTGENTRLLTVEKEYTKLARDAANVLKLNSDYKALVKESQEQKDKILSLEKNLENDTKFWFLSGAGVFLVGVLLGLSSRPGRKTNYSRLS